MSANKDQSPLWRMLFHITVSIRDKKGKAC
jgi:hypothetical protein